MGIKKRGDDVEYVFKNRLVQKSYAKKDSLNKHEL